jgi:Holliday junction resolvase
MAINSNAKGKVGERELAKVLREYGFECRRSQQYAGGVEESADIIGLPYIHVECKRVEALNVDKAMEQAKRDTKDNLPAVFHRKNGKQWKVTMYLDDWMGLYQEYYSGKEIDKRSDND